MKVFISWSGNESHKIACILRDWLPTVIHQIEPWVSSEDIKKGDRWSIELSKQLDEMNFGIICIDPTNSTSPWLNFEAGALSKSLEQGKIFPILFGMPPADLKGPISQFQVTSFEKEDFYRLMRSMNLSLGTEKNDSEKLIRSFEIAWSGLLEAVNNIQNASPHVSKKTEENPRTNKHNDVIPVSLKAIKFKIIYSDGQAENAVTSMKIVKQAGGNVELERLESATPKQKSWNGCIFYRSANLLESAVEAKNILSKFGANSVALGHFGDNKTDLVFWLSDID